MKKPTERRAILSVEMFRERHDERDRMSVSGIGFLIEVGNLRWIARGNATLLLEYLSVTLECRTWKVHWQESCSLRARVRNGFSGAGFLDRVSYTLRIKSHLTCRSRSSLPAHSPDISSTIRKPRNDKFILPGKHIETQYMFLLAYMDINCLILFIFTGNNALWLYIKIYFSLDNYSIAWKIL